MSHFEISEKTGYSGAWIFLFVLLIAGIVVWLSGFPRVALAMAAVGLLFAAYFRIRGRKKVGGRLEFTEQGMIFWEEEEARCIAFKEIKSIRYSRAFGLGEEVYLIETTVGNKRSLKPQDYENCDQLKIKLRENFESFNCPII